MYVYPLAFHERHNIHSISQTLGWYHLVLRVWRFTLRLKSLWLAAKRMRTSGSGWTFLKNLNSPRNTTLFFMLENWQSYTYSPTFWTLFLLLVKFFRARDFLGRSRNFIQSSRQLLKNDNPGWCEKVVRSGSSHRSTGGQFHGMAGVRSMWGWWGWVLVGLFPTKISLSW